MLTDANIRFAIFTVVCAVGIAMGLWNGNHDHVRLGAFLFCAALLLWLAGRVNRAVNKFVSPSADSCESE
jgi:hypothetical protein